MRVQNLRLRHTPRRLIGLVAIGVAVGVTGGALEHRIVPPSGDLGAVSPGAFSSSRMGVALDTMTLAKGQSLSGRIDLSVDDGVRGVGDVDVAVLAVGPNPRLMLARIAVKADSSGPGRFVFEWDQVAANGTALGAGDYELFIRAPLHRDANDRRPPFATALAGFTVK
jgi:hypothetical protein